jgi:nucleosome assembly protein 1-like 1
MPVSTTPEKLNAPPRTQAAKEAEEEVKTVPPHIECLPKEQKDVVDKMVELDKDYLKIEKEFDVEMAALMAKYEKKYAPVLEQRAAEAKSIPGFWRDVLKRSEEFCMLIEDHDMPVLAALEDVKAEYFENRDDGWKLSFYFAENAYFTNKVLTKTYYMEAASEYDTSVETTKITSDKIEWKAGKNVTVETVVQKVKGGGKKKAKAKAKAKEVARASFFRFFRDLGPQFDIPSDVEDEDSDEDDEEEDEDKLERLMDEDGDAAEGLRDNIIPHAVRYYTHEAGAEIESDDEDEDDDDEDDEDEDGLSDTPP